MGELNSKAKTFADTASTLEKNQKGGLIALTALAVAVIGAIVKAAIDAVSGNK